MEITRRQFIKTAFGVCAGLLGTELIPNGVQSLAQSKVDFSKEALHYSSLDKSRVKCALCPHQCILNDGQRGLCKVREPKDGKLYSLVYELPCSMHIDPIEKKPMYHMLPGSKSFSIATVGCNLRCKFCQNWQISQEYPENSENKRVPCSEIVRLAEKNKCRSIAYTYSEPTVFYEYMYNTARIAKTRNIKNIWVTGGFIKAKPLIELCTVIDAANIDFKAYSDDYLREVCNERLEPLLNTLKIAKENGIWIELTNLVVPTLNDDFAMIKDMCAWIRENLGRDTPLHFSRFWPMYKLKNLPPTPMNTLKKAREIARGEGLNYVYIGNVPQGSHADTACPKCSKVLVRRAGYFVLSNDIVGSNCKFCGHRIAGIWE